MLVLTRGVGETIYVGEDIRIKVVGVEGKKARILIDAPQEVHIRRAELVVDISSDIALPASDGDSRKERKPRPRPTSV